MPTRTPLTEEAKHYFHCCVSAAESRSNPPPKVTPDTDGILDQSIDDLKNALPAIASIEALRGLLASEQAGKTRKGAVKAIEAEIVSRMEG